VNHEEEEEEQSVVWLRPLLDVKRNQRAHKGPKEFISTVAMREASNLLSIEQARVYFEVCFYPSQSGSSLVRNAQVPKFLGVNPISAPLCASHELRPWILF
jgi:hypothetical protein